MTNAYGRLKKFGPLNDAEMADLEKSEGRYTFRITGSDGFNDALDAVKAAFRHGSERSYDPGTHRWSVPATQESRERLSAIFSNAEREFVALEAQTSMFDDKWS